MDRERKQYIGKREGDAAVIAVDGVRLSPARSLKVVNHSPTGFEWGYAGSGPAQAALAILLDYTGDARFAEMFHQRFKFHFVASQPKSGWVLPSEEIEAFIVGVIAEKIAVKDPLCGCLHYEYEHFDDELDKGCTYCPCDELFVRK